MKTQGSSWGELTDEIQHDGISVGKYFWSQIKLKAYQTSELETFRGKDFYLVPIIRRNKVTGKMEIPPLIVTRHSCPTPVYNQHVFKYHYLSRQLEHLWTIPQHYKYVYYLKNAKELLKDPQQAQQTQFCLLMESGQMLDWVKKQNGETADDLQMVIRPNTPQEPLVI